MSYQGQDEDEETTGSDGNAGDDTADEGEADEAEASKSGADDEGGGAAPGGEPAAAPPAAAPAAPVPQLSPEEAKEQAIRDHLAKQFAAASDDSGVKRASEDADRQRTIANVGQALEGLARSNSMAHGGTGVDAGFYQHMRDQANQGIDQARNSREQAVRDFVTKEQLGRQGVQDAQTSRENKVKNDANDPSSKQSQVARHVWESANPNLKLAAIPEWKNMSAADMALVKDPIDLKARLDQKAQQAAELAEVKREHNDAMAGGAAGKAAARTAAEQNKNYKEMFNKGEGGRGAPQAVTKAQVAQSSVKNAQELLNGLPKGPDGQPDFNKMTPQQVHLFNGELEKLATNGSPTEGGRAAQDAGTFAQHWAQFKNKFAGPDGEVAGADLGPFIKQSASYIEGLGKVADQVVNTYRRSNFDNYANAPGLISDQHKAIYKAQHPELFPEMQAQTGPAGSPPGGGKANAAPIGNPNEVERVTADGKRAVFDATTKKFLRYSSMEAAK